MSPTNLVIPCIYFLRNIAAKLYGQIVLISWGFFFLQYLAFSLEFQSLWVYQELDEKLIAFFFLIRIIIQAQQRDACFLSSDGLESMTPIFFISWSILQIGGILKELFVTLT